MKTIRGTFETTDQRTILKIVCVIFAFTESICFIAKKKKKK